VEIDTKAVAGFITAPSDGALAAHVPLLEVRPEWRSQGLGRHLVELMLAPLQHHYMVDVVCDDDVLPFYEQLGFTRWTAAIAETERRCATRASGDSGRIRPSDNPPPALHPAAMAPIRTMAAGLSSEASGTFWYRRRTQRVADSPNAALRRVWRRREAEESATRSRYAVSSITK
jgi:hypothetical protein